MIQENAKCISVKKLTPEIYQLTFRSSKIAKIAKPGQFINLKVDNTLYPLLRRPFSISDIVGENVSIIFNVVGEGTKRLVKKVKNDLIDIIGPCGNSFPIKELNKNTFVYLVAGGLGVAPFPFLLRKLSAKQKFITILGARNRNYILKNGLSNMFISTDDGSVGLKGNVIDLLRTSFSTSKNKDSVIFACGPTPMIKAVSEFAMKNGITVYASLECDMACGIGLCQGCNIEMNNHTSKYELVCKNGPIFNLEKIKF